MEQSSRFRFFPLTRSFRGGIDGAETISAPLGVGGPDVDALGPDGSGLGGSDSVDPLRSVTMRSLKVVVVVVAEAMDADLDLDVTVGVDVDVDVEVEVVTVSIVEVEEPRDRRFRFGLLVLLV